MCDSTTSPGTPADGPEIVYVSNEQQLNQAIIDLDSGVLGPGNYEIDFANNITEGTDTGQAIQYGGRTLTAPADLYALNTGGAALDETVTINGNGYTLDGAGTYRGFFILTGQVKIENITLQSTVAKGGNGAAGGGGGAGLGGGIYVAGGSNGASVFLNNVVFAGNAAIGGNGGGYSDGVGGGGGGLGGNGGGGSGGGGGGIGAGAGGGNFSTGGNGTAVNEAGGGAADVVKYPHTDVDGGSFGGGGGGGSGSGFGSVGYGGGGGGGIGGQNSYANSGDQPGNGGNGGYGGGGGGAPEGGHAGSGGFGGGGGGGTTGIGGQGGFGGGGGASNSDGHAGGQGGFGAGNGDSGTSGSFGGGGGGLGAGGDVFVQEGGYLMIEGGTLGSGTVQAGSPGTSGAGAGAAYGSGIFIQRDNQISLSPNAGETLTVTGSIDDQSGSGGTGDNAGSGSVSIGHEGTVIFAAANNFTGGTTITGHAVLELNAANAGGSGGIDIFGATVILNAACAAGSGEISFGGGVPGVLEFSIASAPDDTIAGFDFGGEIKIGDIKTSSTQEVFLTNNVLSIPYEGDQDNPLNITFAGDYTGYHFFLDRDPGNPDGTLITVQQPCFASGTRIAAPGGRMVPVEALRAGDKVLTTSGVAAVRWTGQRTLSPRRHPRPDTVRPVLISAGALGRAMPLRDLLVSPDHALYLDRHLVPAKTLLNGVTIRQLDLPTVTYHHIELAEHAVLFAEGLPAESYLDTGNRHAFEDGGGAMLLHPDFAQTLRMQKSCAPLVEHGPVVQAIRRRILARAGIETTAEPDLEIRYQAGGAIIASRSTIPGETTADPRDRRRLGVKIAGLWIAGQPVPLDHPALEQGWHDPEPEGRWTNGQAMIPPCLLTSARTITIKLAATLLYPTAAAPHEAPRALNRRYQHKIRKHRVSNASR